MTCRIHGAVELPCHVCLVNERDQLRACMTTQLAVHQAEREQLRAEVAALRERAELLKKMVVSPEENAAATRASFRVIEGVRDRAIARAEAAEVERLRAGVERLRAVLHRCRSDAHEISRPADNIWNIANAALEEVRPAHPQLEEPEKR